jgi:hypothetical protein
LFVLFKLCMMFYLDAIFFRFIFKYQLQLILHSINNLDINIADSDA